MCPCNTTFLYRFLYRITTSSPENLCLHKDLTSKKLKYLLLLRFKPNVGKTSNIEEKMALTFNIKQNLFFKKSKFYKRKFTKICMS